MWLRYEIEVPDRIARECGQHELEHASKGGVILAAWVHAGPPLDYTDGVIVPTRAALRFARLLMA